MKKTFRRIITVLLTGVLLFTSVTFPSFAAGGGSKIPGIDYNKIHMGTKDARMGVYISLGPYNAHGDLICGNRLTLDEVNDAVNIVLNQYGITSQQIVEAERRIRKAEAVYDFSIRDNVESIFAMVPGSTQMSPAVNFVELVTGYQKPTAGQLTTFAIGVFTAITTFGMDIALIPAALVGVVTTLWATVVGRNIDLIKEEGLTELGEAIVISAALSTFYDDVNRVLEKLVESKNRTCQIVFDGATCSYPVSFMGTDGNTMYIRAKGVLTKDEPVDFDKYRSLTGKDRMDIFNGTYKGDLDIEIWFDMNGFDTGFKDQVFLGETLPFRKLKSSCKTIEDQYSKTGLKKVLHQPGLTVEVSPKTRDIITLDMNDFINTDTIKIDHRIHAVPNKLMTMHDSSGKWTHTGGSNEIKLGYDFSGAVDSGKYVDLILNGAEWNYAADVHVPYVNFTVENGNDFGSQGTVRMDPDLYYFLRNDPCLCFVAKTFQME